MSYLPSDLQAAWVDSQLIPDHQIFPNSLSRSASHYQLQTLLRFPGTPFCRRRSDPGALLGGVHFRLLNFVWTGLCRLSLYTQALAI